MIAISRRLILGIYLVLLFLLLQCPSPVFAATITGKVVKVADGDTITILTPQKKQVKIRLYGIDTPESGQAYSKKAKQLTSSLVAGKDVHVEVFDMDRYGRTVGVVFANSTNVNLEIIRYGYAWQYKNYCKASFCFEWLRLEKKAREKKVGLWADPKAMPPWEWRKSKRE